MISNNKRFYTVCICTTILAFTVVLLGAYTRLSESGLGCPDWPGCYGHLKVPQDPHVIASLAKLYPQAPFDQQKAWPEMLHRYFAASLGILIVIVAAGCLRRRLYKFASGCLLLLGIQGLLGMWTVTWKLHPLTVMGHLMTGMTLSSLLWFISLKNTATSQPLKTHPLSKWIILVLLLLFTQIFLGAWTSANYAALSCPDFPTCRGSFWPNMDFKQAFSFLHPIGLNYQGGILSDPARIAIHISHRYGALITAAAIFLLAFSLLRKNHSLCRKPTLCLLCLLLLQMTLGATNILKSLPLPIALLHNGTALLLAFNLIFLYYRLQQEEANYAANTPS
jgi:heme a synthase